MDRGVDVASRDPAMVSAEEARIQAIGRALFERVKNEAHAFFRADRWTSELMEWALRHDEAKLRLFRFVDVLPALADDAEVVRHLREYFGDQPGPFAGLTRVGLGLAGLGPLGAKAVAAVLRQSVKQLARRFIAGRGPDDALQAILEARRAGQAFTVDVLGEACTSEEEAAAYERRYLELVERLGSEAKRWPPHPRLDRAAWGELPRVNLSVKLSALYPYLDPIDPGASAEAVKPRLQAILRAAQLHGAHVQIDMEDYRLKGLTLRIFMELCEEEEFRRNRNVGVVLQAYLKESEADARRLIDWARQRGTPVTVRLVKGAYWDYEVAHAALEGWPVPVYETKRETDASYERLTRLFLEHADAVDLAVASHNIRSIAHALAWRERLGLPQNQVEFQALYGMAGPLVRALAEEGERVRIYMPLGELIPGMAYLVRRLLENTSNESFLRRGFAEGDSPEVLLADPARPGRPGQAEGRAADGRPDRGRAGAGRPDQRQAGGAADGSPVDEHASEHAPAKSTATPPAPSGSPVDERAPERAPAGAAAVPPPGALPPFRNEPRADFAHAAERERFAAALAAVRRQFGQYYPLVIGRERIETAESLASVDPSRPADVVGRTASASAEDVDRAVAAAEQAFAAWRDLGVAERGRFLRRAAELLRERRAELAAWIVYEAGKPWREADADVTEAIDFVEYYSRQAPALLAPRRLGELPGESNQYRREPRGVVGVIAPWNFPLAILTGMTSAALATGNTVVMKPAEQTPVIAAKLAALLQEAGLPPGVVNYVPGRGEVAGARLVRHPAVRVIAFTGSREVGTAIYAAAAEPAPGARHLKRVVAEMGGKNAIVVDDDADLDEAVQGIVASAFGYAGQKCSACSRVIAVGRIYPRLLERLVEATRTVPFGPADQPTTVVGPLIDAASQARVKRYIELGKTLARPVLVRELPAELERLGGHYVPPAIFADVPPASPLGQEEIFGPVLAVMPASTFEEALRLALDVDYGLTGGVFSRSPAHLAAARERFQVGNLYLNRGTTGALVGRQPFGGRRLSGVGYQAGGPDYLIQFVETRVITENTLRRGFASGELAS